MDRLEERCLLSTGMISGQILDGAQPLAGVTVYLDQNRNEIPDLGEPTTTTDATGAYAFSGLELGTYAVTQVPPDGFIQSSPAPLRGEALLGEVLETQPAPGAGPSGLAWVNGELYAVDWNSNRIDVIDPATWAVTRSFQTPGNIFDITHDGTHFWGIETSGKIIQFDSSGGEIRQFQKPGASTTTSGIAWDAGAQALWVLDFTATKVDLIDPVSEQPIRSIPAPADRPTALDFDGTHLWLNVGPTRTTYGLDPASGVVVRSFDTPSGSEDLSRQDSAYGIAFDGNALWIAQTLSKQIFQVGVRSPAPQVVELTDTITNVGGVDFVNFQLGTISGTVFDDQDGDGLRGAGEPGLDGWRTYLDTDGDGQFDSWEPTAAVDASGSFTFTGLRDRSYDIGVVQRAPGWVLTSTPVQTATITASGQVVSGIDFGQSLQDVGPVGTEFRVDNATAGLNSLKQFNSVAADAAGNFVVVWESADASAILARLYAADGTPLGDEFQVNDSISYRQDRPVVAMDDAGNFAVAWSIRTESSIKNAVLARVFNADGTPRTGDLTVIPYSNRESKRATSIAMDADGDFVVVTHGYKGDWLGANFNDGLIHFQRLDAQGQAQGKLVQVADMTLELGGSPAVAMDDVGNFVVAWGDSDDVGIRVQRFDASGQAVGGEIATGLTDHGYSPSVAMNGDGRFAVSALGALRIFDPSGSPLSDVISYGAPEYASWVGGAAFDARGDVVISWSGNALGNQLDILAQRFSPSGSPREAPFLVNSTIAGRQFYASVATDGLGGMVIAWLSTGPGDDQGVFAQRYAAPPPPAGPPTIAGLTANPNPVTQGQDLTLTASGVADDSQVVQVAFYRDGGDGVFGGDDVLLGTDADGSDGWALVTPIAADFPIGVSIYFAQATDDLGNLSAPVSTTNEVVSAGDGGGGGGGNGGGNGGGKGGGPKKLSAASFAGAETSAAPLYRWQLRFALRSAQAFWRDAGADLSLLGPLDIRIGDLPGTTLGQADGPIITLDRDAAGHGWFFDFTPGDVADLPADRMDLLSAVAHEIGHALGHDHDHDHDDDEEDVMAPTLSLGERRIPVASAHNRVLPRLR